MSKFEESIKSWVQLDNKIREHNNEIKKIRDKRNELTEKINDYVQQNELKKAVINISDGRLKFQTTKMSNPLSLKFVKQCISEYISYKNIDLNVDELIEFMKENRESKYVDEIKRFYN
jgi:seryl-tRNA synthetase